MEAFVWSDRYLTGFPQIDEQHRTLMDIVNRVGVVLVTGTADNATIEHVFRELTNYANTHFRDEEAIMREAGLDAGYRDHHHRVHHDFVEQLKMMWKQHASMADPAATLHGFLVAWLSYHILGEDQAMAREMVRIRNGLSASEAHACEAGRGERSTGALLGAMKRLYGALSAVNREMAAANAELEAKVADRTRQLSDAHEKLQMEHHELTDLLGKINAVQSQLIQSEKMASIGQLAAGIAHEINTPIGFVGANLGVLKRSADKVLSLANLGAATPAGQALCQDFDFAYFKADLHDLLRESLDGIDRVDTIIARLMDFSGVSAAEWQPADLLDGLESTIIVASHELRQKAEIVRDLKPLPPVHCVPAQINQVFLALLLNAAQSIPQRGTITLRSQLQNGWAMIEIADNGCGMTADVRNRIFEPFFTTRPVGSGTGLGLSISYDIIKKHGGQIEVASNLGTGTQVRIFLPLAADQSHKMVL